MSTPLPARLGRANAARRAAFLLVAAVIGLSIPPTASRATTYNVTATDNVCTLTTGNSDGGAANQDGTRNPLFTSSLQCRDAVYSAYIDTQLNYNSSSVDGGEDDCESYIDPSCGLFALSVGTKASDIPPGVYDHHTYFHVSLFGGQNLPPDPWVAWDPRLQCIPQPGTEDTRIDCTLEEPIQARV